jgi:tRNA-Thr(GGU) m(6)t(6)A37 methyltransferase TsaA
MNIQFKPIGVVKNAISQRHDMPHHGVTSEIHIAKKYQRALYRIGQESHLWILCYLHQARRDVLVAKPRKSWRRQMRPLLACGPLLARGVFSIHSPDRPNPIALTKVKLLSRRGLVLTVAGLDVVDKTPVLDIKGAT